MSDLVKRLRQGIPIHGRLADDRISVDVGQWERVIRERLLAADRLERLQEALKPFALAGKTVDINQPSFRIWPATGPMCVVYTTDLINAAKALDEKDRIK